MRKFAYLLLISITCFISCNFEGRKLIDNDITFSINSSLLLNESDIARDVGDLDYYAIAIVKNPDTGKKYSSKKETLNPYVDSQIVKFNISGIIPGNNYTIGIYVYENKKLIKASIIGEQILTAGKNKISFEVPNAETLEQIDILKMDLSFNNEYINIFTEDKLEDYGMTTPGGYTQINLALKQDGEVIESICDYLKEYTNKTVTVTSSNGRTEKIDIDLADDSISQFASFSCNIDEPGTYKMEITMEDEITGIERTFTGLIQAGSQLALYSKTDDKMTISCVSKLGGYQIQQENVIDYTFAEDGSIYYLYDAATANKYYVHNSMETFYDPKEVTTEYCSLSEITYDRKSQRLFVAGIENGSQGVTNRIIEIDKNDHRGDGDSVKSQHTLVSPYQNFRENFFLMTAENNVLYTLQMDNSNQYVIDAYDVTNKEWNPYTNRIFSKSFNIPFEYKSGNGYNKVQSINITDFVVNNGNIYITYSHNETGSTMEANHNYGGVIIHKTTDADDFVNLHPSVDSRAVPKYCKYEGQNYPLYDSNDVNKTLEDARRWKHELNLVTNNIGENAKYMINPRRIIGLAGNIITFSDCGLYISRSEQDQYYVQKQQKIFTFDAKKNSKSSYGLDTYYNFGESIVDWQVPNGTTSYSNPYPMIYYNNEWKQVQYNGTSPSCLSVGSNYFDIEELDPLP